jgi:glycosyltransferase involved in cell wall biosynthesis
MKELNIIKDTVVVIPAFNEEASIQFVIADIPKERILEIIVVNNNSTDSTKENALKSGAKVIDETIQGYGIACLTGIREGLKFNPKIFAFVDADYSDNPAEIAYLLKSIDNGSDLVIGSRILGKAEKGALLPQAYWGNKLAMFLMQVFFKPHPFTDLGPMRAITTEALNFIEMKDTNFGWTVEMQIKALVYDLKCDEISVEYKKRIGVSKITGTVSGTIKASYKILFTIFKWWPLSWFNNKKIRDNKNHL